MTEENNELVSLDVVYFFFSLILLICMFVEKDKIDVLLFVVTTIYYIRIKIYRWKKYH